MKQTKIISIRVSDADFRRLEDDALKSGYRNLSAYLREQFCQRRNSTIDRSDPIETWLLPQEIKNELKTLTHDQRTSKAMLAAILFLQTRNATPAVINELRSLLRNNSDAVVLIKQLPPELKQFVQSSESE